MENKIVYPSHYIAKIIFFISIQLATCIVIVGLLPTIFLSIGFWLSCRDRDLLALRKTSIWVKIYIYSITLIASCCQIWDYFGGSNGFNVSETFQLVLAWWICAIAYHFILNTCLISPAKAYIEFLKEKDTEFTSNQLYSIADKLIKLKELRDHDLISDEEFLKRKNELKKTQA